MRRTIGQNMNATPIGCVDAYEHNTWHGHMVWRQPTCAAVVCVTLFTVGLICISLSCMCSFQFSYSFYDQKPSKNTVNFCSLTRLKFLVLIVIALTLVVFYDTRAYFTQLPTKLIVIVAPQAYHIFLSIMPVNVNGSKSNIGKFVRNSSSL